MHSIESTESIESIDLISSTVKRDTSCNEISLHKLESGDILRIGYPSNHIGVQVAVLPWKLLRMLFGIAVSPWQLTALLMEFGVCRFTWPSVSSCSGPVVPFTE